MTTETSDQPETATASRHQAAFARMEEVVRQASAPAPTHGRAPQHAAGRSAGGRARRRLRAVALTVLVLLAAAAVAALVARSLQRPPAAQAAAKAAAPAATRADVVRLEGATADMQAALASEQAGLAALHGIPTPASVAPVLDAYAASLRLYGQLLLATPVPVRARAEAAAAGQQVRTDATRLQGVATLPPVLLGAFLEDTTARAARFAGVLGSLDHALASPSPR